MKTHTTLRRPSFGVLLVVLLFLALDLVVIGLLSSGPTRMLLGLGLTDSWLLFTMLSCSQRIRGESLDFLRQFLDAAKDFDG